MILTSLPAAPLRAEDDCSGESFASTYDLIQKAIFENKGCTELACHGAVAPGGGLVLTADVSYQNLVSQPAETVSDAVVPGLRRVVPGQKDQSLLFLNLAAATLPEQWRAPLRAMPIGFEPLSIDELEAVREWIEHGAPREGTVPGTAELLDACLPPAKPIEIEPLEPPAPGTGVQIRMPKWTLAANREDEVCFTSYFDLTDQVPAEFLGDGGNSFRYRSSQIRQDPLSHHLIVNYYAGNTPPDAAVWGPYRCRGGEKDGQSCEPTDLDFCGPEGLCASNPRSGAVCIGYGPNDRTEASFAFAGIQEASSQQFFPPGTYREAPIKGLIVWNSHAFNLTDEAGKVEGWLNFEFAPPEDQRWLMANIFNTTAIFGMSVPPFTAQEVCQHHVFPPNTRLYEINSHTHQRGKRFRVFRGSFQCQGGPRSGAPCAPLSPGLPVPDLCQGAPCAAIDPPEFGDCDGDGRLSVSDLVTCVGIALETRPMRDCPSADMNRSGSVSVEEVVSLVGAALAGPTVRDPEESLLYTNLIYNDPTVVIYDPAMPFPGPGSSRDLRTLTYCSLYDNGYTDPRTVKRRSTSPPSTGPLGGPCQTPTGCTEGRVGSPCSGNNQAARNASCDTSPGAGDGFCDACRLVGGFTTEDEMFILMGAYYVEN
jgi:hypothetical protein